jgi:hypothetical protein
MEEPFSNIKYCSKIVLVGSSMPCEISLAALANFMGVDYVTIHMQSMNKVDEIEETIRKKCDGHDSYLVFVGSYWNEEMLRRLSPKHAIIRYNYPETPKEGETYATNPHFWLASFIFAKGLSYENVPFQFKAAFIETNKRFLILLDERFHSKNVTETELLFSGLYVGPLEKNSWEILFDNVSRVFEQKLFLDDVIKAGRSIVETRMSLANERVLNNSSVRTLYDGTKVVLTNAPDLINVTHERLHAKYPDVQVTATMALQLKNDKVELSLSLRKPGENNPFDLKSFITEINETVATSQKKEHIGMGGGGRVEFPQLVEFLENIHFLKKQ